MTLDVVNSRKQVRLNQVWRRRHCIRCSNTYTTTEQLNYSQVFLVETKDSDEPFTAFQRDKLFLSIYESLKHRKTALEDATGLTATVISKLMPHHDDPTLNRKEIVELVTEVLNRFDKPAAIYYKAFHPINP